MNDYIIIDDGTNQYKYATLQRNWLPQPMVPSTSRLLLSGELDTTFASGTLVSWQGEIVAPVTPRAAGWGTITTLRAQLKMLQRHTFSDHYGNAYPNAHFQGPFNERSAIPDWDNVENKFYVTVKILAKQP
jgi:hypothetical protein